MKLFVIGIAGKAKAGKTTLANAIREHLVFCPYDFIICTVLSLADPLKDECALATQLPRAWFDDPTYKETLRPLMQWWGTEFRRNPFLGGQPSYWIDQTRNHIKYVENEAQRIKISEGSDAHVPAAVVVIVPDVRFPDEANLIHEFENGLMINLLALGAEETTHSSHSSEKGLPTELFDLVYNNDHTKGTQDLIRIAQEFYDNYIAPAISR